MTTEANPAHRRALIALVLVTVAVVLVDQLTKAWAVAVLEPRMLAGDGPIPIVGSALFLTFYENPGASFGFATGFTWILTAVALAVVIGVVRISRRLASLPWGVALGALLGGALGNLGDRLFRAPGFAIGHVVDFIGFGTWFVNNIADIAITLGAVAMVVLALTGIDVDGTRRTPAADEASAEPTA